MSIVKGVSPKWKPDSQDWCAIETGYGCLLGEELRSKISLIVNKYFQNEAFGRSAPFVEDGIEWLTNLEKVLLSLAKTHNGTGDAKVYAEWLLLDHFDDLTGQTFSLKKFVKTAGKAAWAARQAIEEISDKDHQKFGEKNAWKVMINSLRELMTSEKLPIGVSKGGIGRTSPFVSFIRELQATFEQKSLARHTHSDETLATEIITTSREFVMRKVAAQNSRSE